MTLAPNFLYEIPSCLKDPELCQISVFFKGALILRIPPLALIITPAGLDNIMTGYRHVNPVGIHCCGPRCRLRSSNIHYVECRLLWLHFVPLEGWASQGVGWRPNDPMSLQRFLLPLLISRSCCWASPSLSSWSLARNLVHSDLLGVTEVESLGKIAFVQLLFHYVFSYAVSDSPFWLGP